MILFSDLHLKPESEDVCFEVLAKVRELAEKSKDKRVGFLGDFWHMRYQVPVHLLNRLHEEFVRFQEAEITLLILPGNHDQIDVLGANALEVFEAFDHVNVFTEPAVVDGILWMPYRRDPLEVQHALDWARKQKIKNVFAHLPIQGALQNNNHADTDGLPVGMFKGFRSVMLGHYHKQQTIANGMACYVGSPYQTRADEWGQEKGFVEWHPNKKFTRHNFVFGKRYHRIDGLPMAPLEGIGPEDHVKIVVQTEAEAKELRKDNLGAKELVIEVKESETTAPRFGFAKGTTLTEYASAFVEEHKGAADPKDLLRIFEEVRNG